MDTIPKPYAYRFQLFTHALSNGRHIISICFPNRYLHLFIVLFCSGKGKPANTELVRSTIDQLGALQQHGLQFGGRHLRVELGPILADAPAKSYIKHIKGHRDGNL